NAFNAVPGFSDYSFYVQDVTNMVGDWVGTAYELPGVYAQVQSGYVVYEVVCQSDAHDTPYLIYPGEGHSSYTYTVIDADDATTVYSGFFYQQQTGSFGTKEINSQVAMTNSGDVVVGWQQYSTSTAGYYDTGVNVGHPVSTKTSQIFLRSFKESTDNAGPIVTQVALPDGTRVEEGQTVTSTIKDLVVSFDENLMTKVCGYNSTHSVDNLANWVLLCDGVETANAIESISFGMSASRQLALDSVNPAVNGGTLALGSNKWEAVIRFKDGYELTTGNYTLIAKCYIQDVAGNALYAQGLNFPASDYKINFSIISLNTPLAFDTEDAPFTSHYVPEIVVSDPDGDSDDSEILTNPSVIDNITRRDVLDEESSIFETPGNPNSVASDANGNFVVVWTSTIDQSVITDELAKDTGVWVKIYRQEYVMDANGKRTYVNDVIKEFKIEETAAYKDDAGTWHFASQASVALNDKGDFVVVWDQYNKDSESRDVYARRYTLMGKEIGINGGYGNFMVNIYDEKDQQNASVAMDADGDFVIVWESFGQDYDGQDTGGLYGRRFTNDGYSFGITDTQQTITIGGAIVTDKYVMRLTYTDENGNEYTTSDIAIQVETAKNTENI
ncbi:MAG: hypothetical protein Q4G59_11700, partial [Planctomycetia bacterium]|nr:hypothetical protein [Planctomycetia bacterium]